MSRRSIGCGLSRQLVPALVLATGCTAVLDIDNEYALEVQGVDAGGARGGVSGAGRPNTGAGGGTTAGTGGRAAAGTSGGGQTAGGAGAGGLGGAGGAGGAACSNCSADSKCCAGLCISRATDSPLTGCSTDTCRCPQPPDQAVAECGVDGECTIVCNPGYVDSGGTCVPDSGGGGAGGAGGAPPQAECSEADVTQCPPCGPQGPFVCCRNNLTCGCTWVIQGYCL